MSDIQSYRKELENLKYHLRLLLDLVEEEKAPYSYFIVKHSLPVEVVESLEDLCFSYVQRIKSGENISFDAFRSDVDHIHKAPSLPDELLLYLKKSERFPLLYQYFDV